MSDKQAEQILAQQNKPIVKPESANDVATQKVLQLCKQKTLLLATRDEQGLPHVSYVPFVMLDGAFYIYVSALAAHTKHLQQFKQAEVMLIEDEVETRNLFARNRVNYAVSVSSIAKDHEQYNEILDQLQTRCGPTVKLLRTLPDFELFCLQPGQATLVIGFGQAYRFNAQMPQELTQITEKNINLLN